LGCGHYSTAILASIAKSQNRRFEVVTSSDEWARTFTGLGASIEVIRHEDWPSKSFDTGPYGMVLVDHEELVSARFAQLFKLSDRAKIVVFHDANRIEEQGISWGMAHLLYRHIYFFEKYLPSTAILSHEADPAEWFNG
jgi:hypothetical protein